MFVASHRPDPHRGGAVARRALAPARRVGIAQSAFTILAAIARSAPARSAPALVAALALFSPWVAPAQAAPELGANIEEGHSYPIRTFRFGDTLYTAALADGGGYRLYRVDLVTGVKEPEPALPVMEEYPTVDVLDTQIICQGEELGGDPRVWTFDGSVATVIFEPPEDVYATNFFELGGLILFSCNGGGDGYEPWISDGTLAGTSQLMEINPSGGSNPNYEVAWNGEVYLRADDGSTGVELWKTDGTVGGTVLVRDIALGSTSSTPLYLTVSEDQLIFLANDALYRSDGTFGGTTLVSSIGPSDIGGGFVVAPNWAYYSGEDPSTGIELYRTDGNVVELVADVLTGPDGSQPVALTAVGSQIYFAAKGLDLQLWISDGTSGGTTLVADLNPAGSEDFTLGSLTEHEGALYFTASDPGGIFERELWRSDGGGAAPVKLELVPGDLGARPTDLVSGIDDLWFSANDGSDTGTELWRVANDSTPEVGYDILPNRSSDPVDLLVDDSPIDPTLYLFAENTLTGRTCFSADLDDPTLVVSAVSSPLVEGVDAVRAESELAVGEEHTYVTVETSDAGFEPARVDGGTFHPIDVRPGPVGSDPSDLTIAGGNLFFVAEVHSTGGYGLFVYEPVSDLTGDLSLLFDFGPDRPTDLLEDGEGVLFVASDPDFGAELWRATPEQVGRLVDINPGMEGSFPADLTRMGEHVFFTATEPSTGRELWCTDGSVQGTKLVANLNAGAISSDPEFLVDGYPYLYFSANVIASGRELYKATIAGVTALQQIVPGPGSGEPEDLAFAESRLYFSADDGSGIGREPWVSNGETVQMAVDLNPGPGSSDPSDFMDHLGAVYFTADDGTNGRELWRGSTGSYVNVSDPIAPGAASALVGEKVSVADSRLIFVAEDSEFGRELWFVSDPGGPADTPTSPVRVGDSLALRAGPNPFDDRLEIRYVLEGSADVRLRLIDAGGRIVAEESMERLREGSHVLDWSPAELAGLPGGVFFLQLQADRETSVRKVLRVR